MAYEGFAYWYDKLNAEADYKHVSAEVARILRQYGVSSGIVADLGCGTGEVSIRLAKAGYSMLAVDKSADMLSVFQDKLSTCQPHELDITLLCQDITALDLYGTIHAAISLFDTFSHLNAEEVALAMQKVSLFSEDGAPFIFDVNTVYKHEKVLGNNCFELAGEDGIVCEWANRYDPADHSVEMELTGTRNGEVVFHETFTEYAWDREFWETQLRGHSFGVVEVLDGESFKEPNDGAQRLLFVAVKQGNPTA